MQAFLLSERGASRKVRHRVYMLFRVSAIGLGGQPVLKIYDDPHAFLSQGIMRIESSSVDVRII